MKLIKFFNNLYKYYNSPKGNHDFWDYFKANGIEIPFPQREVRVLPGASEWSATK